MTPDWFIKACRKVLMWEDDGKDIDPLAHKLWAQIESEMPVKVRGEDRPVTEFTKP